MVWGAIIVGVEPKVSKWMMRGCSTDSAVEVGGVQESYEIV